MLAETNGERQVIEAMWSRTVPFIANALVWGCILLSGGATLGCIAIGVLCLWPGFNPLHLQLAWYPVHLLFTSVFLAVGILFAIWTALFWHILSASRA
jgi:hypothetical protein